MAAADKRPLKYAPYRVRFVMRDSASNPVTGLTPAITLSTDDGAPGAISGSPSEIGTTGAYYVDLTASEMAYDGLLLRATAGTAVASFVDIKTEGCLASGVAQGGGASSITLASTSSSVDDYYNGVQVEVVKGTGLGQVRTIYDYTGSTRIALVDRPWATTPDNTSVFKVTTVGIRHGTDIVAIVNADQIDGNTAAPTNLVTLYGGGFLHSGSVNDPSATTTSFILDNSASSTNDLYNGGLLVLTSGNAAGQCDKVTDYVGSTKTVTLAGVNGLKLAPANGSSLVIFGKIF